MTTIFLSPISQSLPHSLLSQHPLLWSLFVPVLVLLQRKTVLILNPKTSLFTPKGEQKTLKIRGIYSSSKIELESKSRQTDTQIHQKQKQQLRQRTQKNKKP